MRRHRPPVADPKIHIVDEDVKFGVALAGFLASVGLASMHYASPETFVALASLDAPGCLLLDVAHRPTPLSTFERGCRAAQP